MHDLRLQAQKNKHLKAYDSIFLEDF